jgi:hypothetical protein
LPSNPRTLADHLVQRLQAIDRTRQKVESLLTSHAVGIREVETIYAGLFTNAVITMEGFLEELFLGLLSGQLNRRRSCPRTDFRQRTVAIRFVLHGKDYVQWLPYDQTKERAEIFFRKGRPFSELPGHLEDQLRKASLVRNALVHSSQFAQDQFQEKVVGSTPLAPRERRPVGFLRSNFRASPPQQRFDVYLNVLADSARFLAHKS